jgi:hypothetical protein
VYPTLQQAVSGSRSAQRRRSVTRPLREQQCTRKTGKNGCQNLRGERAPPANQEQPQKVFRFKNPKSLAFLFPDEKNVFSFFVRILVRI